MRSFRRNVLLLLVLLLAGGCHGRLDGMARERLYERTYTVFAAAHLRKPVAGPASERVLALAPLLLHQADPTEPQAPVDPPTVYYVESSIELGDRSHDSITYLWRDPDRDSATPAALQGLRLTLGDDGFPLIYEVLRDSSGARVIFVSTSLEQRAATEFGAPPPGRRFSIESGVDATPNVVVPSVLEPGPVPLGPFVYVQHGSNDIATLICRCSASQVDEVLTSEEYLLEPWTEPSLPEGDARPGRFLSSESLTRLLRLPPEY